MLERQPDVKIVGEAENGLQALELCRSLRPDLVLMDVRMPKMDGQRQPGPSSKSSPQQAC